MIDVVMPQMGESIVEGTLTKWLKKAGDHVERDEPLFEISTDKVDTEIPSPAAGTLAEIWSRKARRSGSIPWSDGSAMARGGGSGQRLPRPLNPQSEPPSSTPPAHSRADAASSASALPLTPEAPVATVVEETAGPLSPLVRKMARENNIDLSQVKGTGAGGRITKQDLESYLASRPAVSRSSRLRRRLHRRQPRPQPAPPPAAVAPPAPPPAQMPVAAQPRRTPATSACAHAMTVRRSAGDARRADEHHAAEDRRAHGVQQAHLGARHHGSQSRHDASRQAARQASRGSSRRSTASA